jgi:predicted flap endonuclease-1-like 5' DNA nuclease
MRVHNFQGVIVISQNVIGDFTNVEKLLDDKKIIASLPETMEVPTPKGLKYIEGIGDVYRQKLRQSGITDVDDLLEKGSTVQGRKEIVNQTGISEKLLLRWVNMADLYRISGIGQEYAELLEAAGVDTVIELAQRVPANLLEKMAAANAQKKMVRRLPDLSLVESWVAQAKSLPRVINY